MVEMKMWKKGFLLLTALAVGLTAGCGGTQQTGAKKHYPESSPSIMNQISNMKKKGTVRDSKKLHATVPFGASGGT